MLRMLVSALTTIQESLQRYCGVLLDLKYGSANGFAMRISSWRVTQTDSPYSAPCETDGGAAFGCFYRLGREIRIPQNWLKGENIDIRDSRSISFHRPVEWHVAAWHAARRVMPVVIVLYRARVCQKKLSSKEEDPWADGFWKQQIRGWRAVSAAGSKGKGWRKRSVCFTDTGVASRVVQDYKHVGGNREQFTPLTPTSD